VWHALHDFVSAAPSGGLSSDAVIEIMLAILGCMIGVLAILAGLVALFFAGLGFFGFQIRREEVVKKVKEEARAVAEETFNQEFKRLTEIDSTVALGDAKSQPEPLPSGPSKGRKVSDTELHKGKTP
jgi:hypothetical protein